MKHLSLFCLCLALPFSVFADDDAFRSIVRGILAPPVEQPAATPKVIRQYPFNPDYADIYLGDDGATNVSIFVEMVFYGSSEESYYVLIKGQSSAGAFQKKMTFTDLEGFLHLQRILEQKEYARLYFYSEGRSATDYTLQMKPTRKAPLL